MHRVYVSLAIELPAGLDGRMHLRYFGHSPYIMTSRVFATHYKTGMSRKDMVKYNEVMADFERIAREANKSRSI
jgi:hypothetical protein